MMRTVPGVLDQCGRLVECFAKILTREPIFCYLELSVTTGV